MPLPTIETPTYELKLPSTNKKIKYRPFLVKEEKILILALESKSQNEITNAVTDVLKKCILTRGIKVDDLPTFDIEYLFLNIRAKSIGEDIKLTVTCPDDGETKVPVTIYVDEIKVTKPKGHTKDIVLDDKMTLRMKYPSLSQFISNNFDTEDEAEALVESLDGVEAIWYHHDDTYTYYIYGNWASYDHYQTYLDWRFSDDESKMAQQVMALCVGGERGLTPLFPNTDYASFNN